MTFKPGEIATIAIVVTGCLCLLLVVAAPIFGAVVPPEIQVFVFSLITGAAGVFVYNRGSSAGEKQTLNTLATLSTQATMSPTLGVATSEERERAARELRTLAAKSGAFTQMKSESQGRP